MWNMFLVSVILAATLVTTSAVPKCPFINEAIATLLPHESDCTKFYKCETGAAIVYDCPSPLHFNPTLKVCDWPQVAGCNSGSVTEPPPADTTANPGEGSSQNPGDGGNGNPDGPECPAEDGEFVTLFPHEDCTKFWKCDRGVAVEKDCPAGLHFNPTLLVCDYPEDAGCTGGAGPPAGTTASPGEGSSQNPGDGGNGGTDGPECPAEDGEFVTLFPHEDCTKFWKCDRGVAVEKDCPAGLQFNPTLLVCDYPEDAGCTGGAGPPAGTTSSPGEGSSQNPGDGGNGGTDGPECPAEDGEFVTLFPHEDCTKFWKCDRGVAVEKDCPAGLQFNPTLLVCDYPEDAGCTGGAGPPAGTTSSPGEGSSQNPGDGGNGGTDGPECPAEDGEFVTLFPHEDCTKFWKCDRGVAVEKDCPAGLHFNPTLLVCDYPEDAGCTGGAGPPAGTTASPGEGSSQNPGDGGNGGTDGPECPAEDGEFVTLFPHEDCTKFWKCDRGVAVEKDCPAGLHFNPTLLVCDYPEDAGCTGGAGPPAGTTASPGEGSSQNPGDGGNGGTDGPECPAEDGEFVTLFPHEDCTKFWKCDRGVAVEKDCPAGLHFNPTLLVCDYPEDAGCTGGAGPPAGTTASPGEGSSQNPGDGGNGGTDGPECPAEDGEFVTLFPHEDCTKFWKCDRGVAVEKDCPAGLHFNPTLLVCDYPEDAGCTGGAGPPAGTTASPGEGSSQNPGDGGNGGTDGPECPAEDGEFVTLFPHEDCTKFWKCDRGVAVEKDCPAGLHFNPTLLVCDYPEDAGCTGGAGPPAGTTASPGEGSSQNPGDGGNGGTDGPECPAEDGEFVTLFPHEDCTKFWKCDRGVAVEKDCPAGLHFNPTLLVCDYPEDAGCTGGAGPPAGTTASPGEGSSQNPGDGGNGGTDGPECPAEDGEFVTLFPHEDCTKFWKCDRGVAVEKDCPAGLHFNPTLLVCDYPEDAGCTGGAGPPAGTTASPGEGSSQNPGDGGNGGTDGPECPAEDGEFVTLFPHEDCTKFWKCDRGVAVEKDCPAGLHFNPTLLVCDYPEDAGCTGGAGPPAGTTASPGEGSSQNPGDGGNGGTDGPECPAEDGEFVTLFPHEDCTKFWKCDRGVAVEKDCPAGLHFNPTLLVCDYPEDAGCTGGAGPPAGTTASPGEGSSQNPGDGGNGGTDGPECPAEDGEFVTLFPHEDCTKFWKCDRGVAVEKDCPAGLHFNPTLLVCDYPEDAGCTGGAGPPAGTTSSPGEGSSQNPGDGGNGGTDGPECPAEDGEFVTLFPHEDCTKFWKCDRGVAVEKDCPAGLHFNPTLLVCDYPEDASCTGGAGPPAGTTSSPGEGSSQNPGDGGNGGTDGPECPAEDGEFVTLFPHEDCTKFWKCDRGVAVEKDCPAGLHFNPTLLVCDYPEDAGCTGGAGPPAGTTASPGEGSSQNPGDGGNGNPDGPECPAEDGEFVTLFPHEDCTKFWKCDRGVAVEKDCPAGLHFNPTLLVCDYPEEAGCKEVPAPPTGTTISPSEGTSQNPGDGGNGNTDGPECPAEDGEFVTLFPHEDCTKFWKCDRGVAVEKDCPAGLHFNPVLLVCDYPEDAGCKGGSGQSTDGTTASTSGSTAQGTTEGTPQTSPQPGNGYCDALGCPELNGKWVYFVTIPNDCTRFCKCDWGTPYEFVCPAGLYFDPVIHVCDYKQNVECEM